MSLVVNLRITRRGGGLMDIGHLTIQRLEDLENHEDPKDEVHRYRVKVMDAAGIWTHDEFELEHRYGDGAWALVAKATKELTDRGYELET